MLSNCPLSKRVQNLDETERTEEQNWAGWVVWRRATTSEQGKQKEEKEEVIQGGKIWRCGAKGSIRELVPLWDAKDEVIGIVCQVENLFNQTGGHSLDVSSWYQGMGRMVASTSRKDCWRPVYALLLVMSTSNTKEWRIFTSSTSEFIVQKLRLEKKKALSSTSKSSSIAFSNRKGYLQKPGWQTRLKGKFVIAQSNMKFTCRFS